MKFLYLFILGVLYITNGFSQISLVHDLTPGINSTTAIGSIIGFKDELIFSAFVNSSTSIGLEPYRYDGVSPPTNIVDLRPGIVASIYSQTGLIHGGKLYFAGDNGNTGMELYSYDGNSIILESDVESGPASSQILSCQIVAVNENLYFYATTSANARELHKFNGSSTTCVMDINPGGINGSQIGSGCGSEDPVVYKGKIYFPAYEPAGGGEIYCHDPATNSTAAVTNMNIPGVTPRYNPSSLLSYGSKMYFIKVDDLYGEELYSFDYTNPPTLLSDLAPGIHSGANLWTNIHPDNWRALIGYDGKIIFSGKTGPDIANVTGSNPYHLYSYDTLTGNMTPILTASGGKVYIPSFMTIYNGKLYFAGYDDSTGGHQPIHGRELWVYDGTNVSLVQDLNVGSASSHPSFLAVWKDALYFSATTPAAGEELFRYVDPMLSTKQPPLDIPSVKLYPNPATDLLTIVVTSKTTGDYRVIITDMVGKQIQDQYFDKMQLSTSLNIRDFANGIYVCSVYDEKGIQTAKTKFVKQ